MDKEFISGSQGRIIGEVISKDSSITSARPTGQGFGAARKGPAVRGPIDAVSDSEYSQGEPFDIGGVKTSPVLGVK
jgi:hypothetical protein|tara:strand:+ start:363 stop:590 length:228 start_codon:yes stop_codon:yes gene_type:complete